jgi:Family of unknown function (DUF5995)
MPLGDILARVPAESINDVITIMQAIDDGLPDTDGVKWFNRLYLRVTLGVRAEIAGTAFNDSAFLAALDVVFANLYFAALRDAEAHISKAPAAWRPLLVARFQSGIARIQFALAGMNAHINRDLPLALVETCRDREISLGRRSPQHRDFRQINSLLAQVEARVKAELVTEALRDFDVALGELDDVIALWKVERARDAAWSNAETLWALRDAPRLRQQFLWTLDRMVGFAGRGLLRPLGSVR